MLVAAAPRRWAPLAGTCFGLYVTVGFVVNGRVYELIGHDGVVEAFGRDDAGEPWLGRGGLAVTAILYVAASALVLAGHLSSQASPDNRPP